MSRKNGNASPIPVDTERYQLKPTTSARLSKLLYLAMGAQRAAEIVGQASRAAAEDYETHLRAAAENLEIDVESLNQIAFDPNNGELVISKQKNESDP